MRALVFGAGAQGQLTGEILHALGRSFAFVDDDATLHGTYVGVAGARVISLDDITSAEDYEAYIALGRPDLRAKVRGRCKVRGIQFGPPLIHPTAYVSEGARLAPGTVVFPHAIVEDGAFTAWDVIINTGAFVGHGARIEPTASICPRAVIGGRVTVGAEALIGNGANVLPRIKVGAQSAIGAGSVVTRNMPGHVLAYGCPAKVIEPMTEARWASMM